MPLNWLKMRTAAVARAPRPHLRSTTRRRLGETAGWIHAQSTSSLVSFSRTAAPCSCSILCLWGLWLCTTGFYSNMDLRIEAAEAVAAIRPLVASARVLSQSPESSRTKAWLELETLEGDVLQICLSVRGYEVASLGQTWESLEALLDAQSPAYRAAFAAALAARLAAIQKEAAKELEVDTRMTAIPRSGLTQTRPQQ
eukprot:m.11922 g.11922  ORF g.11922 m.11922 type:complete len:198 (+) comp3192_c0_seq2:917-1510(+)